LGLAIGPAVIAVFSDYVFRDPSAIKWSIGLAGLTLLPFSLVSVFMCRRFFSHAPTEVQTLASRGG
jgi:hypothetical protein